MDSVSHAAVISSSKLSYGGRVSFNKDKNPLLRSSVVSLRNWRAPSRNLGVLAAQIGNKEIDFSDPDWKTNYQRDFERRFNIPHITDIFPDADPIPSTFCLKMRTPVMEDFAGGYPSDEEWHGYINKNDRVLLKVNEKKVWSTHYGIPKSNDVFFCCVFFRSYITHHLPLLELSALIPIVLGSNNGKLLYESLQMVKLAFFAKNLKNYRNEGGFFFSFPYKILCFVR